MKHSTEQVDIKDKGIKKILAIIICCLYVYVVTFIFSFLIYSGFMLIFERPIKLTTPAGWALILATIFFFIDGSDLPEKVEAKLQGGERDGRS